MDTVLQALVMGIVQGLTEFLPVSSSGHLVLVPFLFGWDDEFLNSLAFSVMLHLGTLVALLVYFREDWARLIPAGLAAARDRSFRGDADRRLAWLLVAATIPAALAGLLFNDLIEEQFREVGLVVVMLVVGGVILFIADRVGGRSRAIADVTFPVAIGHRRGTGAGADPGHQPLRDLDLRGSPGRPGPRGRRSVRIPHGDPDHGGRHRLRGSEAPDRRSRRHRRDRSPRRRDARRACWQASRRSISCCATCGRARSTSSSGTGSGWRRSSSSSGWRDSAAARTWRS